MFNYNAEKRGKEYRFYFRISVGVELFFFKCSFGGKEYLERQKQVCNEGIKIKTFSVKIRSKFKNIACYILTDFG